MLYKNIEHIWGSGLAFGYFIQKQKAKPDVFYSFYLIIRAG
ncbi:hypothetical protein VAEU17_3190010 [Vibrio aestuarianus]|nr:hypothetical protein VAEU17_3190010 [Vibrio aestuarianus]